MSEHSPMGSPSAPVTRANDFIEHELQRQLAGIEEESSSHSLMYWGPIFQGADDLVKEVLEKRNALGPPSDRLSVILTTLGGQVEPVQRIVETIRHFYKYVSFIVPNNAFSAGTILCMSGDQIYMDYYSRLGPIDPQVPGKNGGWVPALGYLRQWSRLLAKEQAGLLTTVELQVMLNFDQAELYMYEQAEQQSIALLEEWLVNYKFQNWTRTEDRGIPVTEDMKRDRAIEVATILNDTDRWHSHGHGISMEVLRRDLKLIIDDLADVPGLYAKIKQYDELLLDYMRRMGAGAAVQMPPSSLILI